MGDGGDATVAYGRRLRRPELRRILRRPEVRLRVAAGFRAIGGEQPCGVTASRAEVTRGDDALAPIQDEQPRSAGRRCAPTAGIDKRMGWPMSGTTIIVVGAGCDSAAK
jgi:hypothetical protein